tara:strand:+ start:1822 stop:2475 length:654 start_codon:yes stop_codon:yes gene_type:complete
MSSLLKRIITSIFLLIILSTSFVNLKILFLLLIVIIYLCLNEFKQIFQKIYINNNFLYFCSILFSLVYLLFFSLTIFDFIFSFENQKKVSLLFILLICVFTDIGGFVFGKLIGGYKFTKISPKKTYSGIMGSFIFAYIVGFLFYNFFNNTFDLKIKLILFILLISFISQIGDLFISFLKRKAKVKDTGSLLPGHGGVLDRIDGILFALPIGIKLISI